MTNLPLLLNVVLATARINKLWHAVLLVIVISLVYAATRHESAGAILRHAARFGFLIVASMGVLFGILQIVSSRL